MTDEKPTISIDPEQLMPGYHTSPQASLAGLGPIFPGDLVLYDATQTTVIRMTAAGELYWRDRLIECDRDLVDGLRDLLAGLKRAR